MTLEDDLTPPKDLVGLHPDLAPVAMSDPDVAAVLAAVTIVPIPAVLELAMIHAKWYKRHVLAKRLSDMSPGCMCRTLHVSQAHAGGACILNTCLYSSSHDAADCVLVLCKV